MKMTVVMALCQVWIGLISYSFFFFFFVCVCVCFFFFFFSLLFVKTKSYPYFWHGRLSWLKMVLVSYMAICHDLRSLLFVIWPFVMTEHDLCFWNSRLSRLNLTFFLSDMAFYQSEHDSCFWNGHLWWLDMMFVSNMVMCRDWTSWRLFLITCIMTRYGGFSRYLFLMCNLIWQFVRVKTEHGDTGFSGRWWDWEIHMSWTERHCFWWKWQMRESLCVYVCKNWTGNRVQLKFKCLFQQTPVAKI